MTAKRLEPYSDAMIRVHCIEAAVARERGGEWGYATADQILEMARKFYDFAMENPCADKWVRKG